MASLGRKLKFHLLVYIIDVLNCIHNIIISFKIFIILFLIIIFVIKNNVVFCNPSDTERIEEDCMFVARQEHGDDNLLDKVVNSEDEAYALYNDYALRTGFSIRKGKPRYFSGSKNIRQ